MKNSRSASSTTSDLLSANTGKEFHTYPFQACDYLAYENFKAVKLAVDLGIHEDPVSEGVEFKPRKSLMLIDLLDPRTACGDGDHEAALCLDLGYQLVVGHALCAAAQRLAFHPREEE